MAYDRVVWLASLRALRANVGFPWSELWPLILSDARRPDAQAWPRVYVVGQARASRFGVDEGLGCVVGQAVCCGAEASILRRGRGRMPRRGRGLGLRGRRGCVLRRGRRLWMDNGQSSWVEDLSSSCLCLCRRHTPELVRRKKRTVRLTQQPIFHELSPFYGRCCSNLPKDGHTISSLLRTFPLAKLLSSVSVARNHL